MAIVLENGGPYNQNLQQTHGLLGYNEICLMLNERGWTVKRDQISKVDYMTKRKSMD